MRKNYRILVILIIFLNQQIAKCNYSSQYQDPSLLKYLEIMELNKMANFTSQSSLQKPIDFDQQQFMKQFKIQQQQEEQLIQQQSQQLQQQIIKPDFFTNTDVKVEVNLNSTKLKATLIFSLNPLAAKMEDSVHINLYRTKCQVNGIYCPIHNIHKSWIIRNLFRNNKSIKFPLRLRPHKLSYNSEFAIDLDYNGQNKFTRRRRLSFTTPDCSNPSDDMSQCNPLRNEHDSSFNLTIICVTQGAHEAVLKLAWPLDKLVKDPSGWSSSLTILATWGVVVNETENMAVELRLAKNEEFRIMVLSRNKTNPNDEIMFHHLNIFTNKQFLTSRSECPKKRSYSLEIAIGMIGLCFVLAICTFYLINYLKYQRIRIVKSDFVKSNSYNSSPAGSFQLLRDSQPITDEWEIEAKEVILGTEIGQGAFGRVMTGFYQGQLVAIKVLKADQGQDIYRDDLLREIGSLKALGCHPSIVTMLGACTVKEPIALIMEYMPYGNLQSFLCECRKQKYDADHSRLDLLQKMVDEVSGKFETWIISSTDILSFARQIALAMEYLSDRQFVHRDLAARNVLLGASKTVKLCDFGLARFLFNGDEYLRRTNGRLPLKWMAIESIRDRSFTTQTDVWSFGVLLWEIATLGISPYPNIPLGELYRSLIEDYRMSRPLGCSNELYQIMHNCWLENAIDRPTFSKIKSQLELMLAEKVEYLDLDEMFEEFGKDMSISSTDPNFEFEKCADEKFNEELRCFDFM